MAGEPGVPPCGLADCVVCVVRSRLLAKGARDRSDSLLFDDDTPGDRYCEVTICDQGDCSCQSRLKIDEGGAVYRATARRSVDTKMCDFAVIAVLPQRILAIVLELKLGTAEWPRFGDQLQEGLRVLHDEFGSRDEPGTLKAYLAVGKQRHETQEFLDTKSVRLNFGKRRVLIEVIDCGSCIDVSVA